MNEDEDTVIQNESSIMKLDPELNPVTQFVEDLEINDESFQLDKLSDTEIQNQAKKDVDSMTVGQSVETNKQKSIKINNEGVIENMFT